MEQKIFHVHIRAVRAFREILKPDILPLILFITRQAEWSGDFVLNWHLKRACLAIKLKPASVIAKRNYFHLSARKVPNEMNPDTNAG
ncbi:MAG TPA: hypothetical protein VK400_03765 [Pyrinomonadaceae bacterium]|nr:hypothetical protein [Pyrinomonadaceae bacterium]